MMNAREMLELAAKAARFMYNPSITIDFPTLWGCWEGSKYQSIDPWNPLTDDGDALRLAVTMFRDIRFWYYCNSVSVGNEMRIPCGEDPYAATRRAIVRAAAKIGKRMK